MRPVSQAEGLLASHEGLRSIELVGLLADMFVSLVALLVRHPYDIRATDVPETWKSMNILRDFRFSPRRC